MLSTSRNRRCPPVALLSSLCAQWQLAFGETVAAAGERIMNDIRKVRMFRRARGLRAAERGGCAAPRVLALNTLPPLPSSNLQA